MISHERSESYVEAEVQDAEIIGALRQLDVGRTAADLGREMGVSKHTVYGWRRSPAGRR